MSQVELTTPSPLLQPNGTLAQAGWFRSPLLDSNLEQAAFYPAAFRFLQRFRIKRWVTFTPFVERVAKTNVVLITSEVHQMFGRYAGTVVRDDGDEIAVAGPIGFAEEHNARW